MYFFFLFIDDLTAHAQIIQQTTLVVLSSCCSTTLTLQSASRHAFMDIFIVSTHTGSTVSGLMKVNLGVTYHYSLMIIQKVAGLYE